MVKSCAINESVKDKIEFIAKQTEPHEMSNMDCIICSLWAMFHTFWTKNLHFKYTKPCKDWGLFKPKKTLEQNDGTTFNYSAEISI